jgi:hypothetical protein
MAASSHKANPLQERVVADFESAATSASFTAFFLAAVASPF